MKWQVIPKLVAFTSESKLFRTFAHVEIRPPGYGYPRQDAAYIGTHISLSYYG